MRKYLGIAQNVLFKPITVPTLPSHAQIEITSFCNLDCVFCPRRHLVGAPKHMPLDQFKDIFDQILPSNINLGGQGEPLLHPNIADIIRYCREGVAAVNFPTNLAVPKSLMTESILRNFEEISRVKYERKLEYPELRFNFALQANNI